MSVTVDRDDLLTLSLHLDGIRDRLQDRGRDESLEGYGWDRFMAGYQPPKGLYWRNLLGGVRDLGWSLEQFHAAASAFGNEDDHYCIRCENGFDVIFGPPASASWHCSACRITPAPTSRAP